MNGTNFTDLVLLLPELILVGMALALILSAHRIRTAPLATAGTVLAAVAAAFVSYWLVSADPKIGFGGMITLDGYSQFFKVLIAAALTLTILFSVKRPNSEDLPRAEYHALLLLASTGMMLAVSALDLLVLWTKMVRTKY